MKDYWCFFLCLFFNIRNKLGKEGKAVSGGGGRMLIIKGEMLPFFQCSNEMVFLSLYPSLVAIPVYVKHNISFRDSSSLGRFEITVGPKQTMGKTIEGVIVTSQMPKGVLNMSLTPSQGTHTFDPVTKVGEEHTGSFELPMLNRIISAGALHVDFTPY